MQPPVVHLESQRRELARTLGLAEDPWTVAAPAAPGRQPRQRRRARRGAGPQPRLRPSRADER